MTDATERRAALHHLADEVASGLRDHFDLELDLAKGPDEAILLGPEGKAVLRLPFQIEAEGRLGELARAYAELVFADEAPEELFPRYLPPKPGRADEVWDLMNIWIEAELADSPRLDPVLVRRGDALLAVNGTDHFVGLPTGDHRGDGVLHLRMRRYLSFAMTGLRPEDLSR